MPEQKTMNGVDTAKLQQVISAIKDNPELAAFKFRARNHWLGGTHCRTTIKDFYGMSQEDTSRKQPFVLECDEPAPLLGEDHGPNATEAALYALTSCLLTTFVFQAAAKGVKIEQLDVVAEGHLDLRGFLGLSKGVRRGFTNIDVTFHVKCNASEEQIEELCRLAQKYSPVFDTVSNPVKVNVRVQTPATAEAK